MSEKECEEKKVFNELYGQYKKEENDLCNAIGIGLDSFKGDDWKNHRFYIEPGCSIRMYNQMIQNFCIYVSETLSNNGPGVYDFVVCLRKKEGDVKKYMDDFQEMDINRKKLVEELKKKLKSLEDEIYEKSQPIPEANDAHKDESV